MFSKASGPSTRLLLEEVRNLGPWFHNLHLSPEVQTAPDHFLGDFPHYKWQELAPHLPTDLRGVRCLDIGCNAGYYSFELAARGATVLAIDANPHYLKQADWARSYLGYSSKHIQFRRMQVHELSRIEECFDLILFMGVFYHLRYPLLALDSVARLSKGLFVFQSLTSEDSQTSPIQDDTPEDLPLEDRSLLRRKAWPKLAFIEKSFVADPTNWWVPNETAVMAILRSTGFRLIKKIAHEMYLCESPPDLEKNRSWDQEEWEAATGQRLNRKKKG